jgi:phage tail-like protein
MATPPRPAGTFIQRLRTSMDSHPQPDALPTAFFFRVGFGTDRDSDAAFQEVGGIGPEMETESYREGGENRFVHALPKGVKHPKLTLKRGIAPFASPLVTWCRDVLEGGLGVRIVPQLVHVDLLNAAAEPLRSWTFENAYPAHWTVDAFQAERGSVAIEKIELNYAVSSRKL